MLKILAGILDGGEMSGNVRGVPIVLTGSATDMSDFHLNLPGQFIRRQFHGS